MFIGELFISADFMDILIFSRNVRKLNIILKNNIKTGKINYIQM